MQNLRNRSHSLGGRPLTISTSSGVLNDGIAPSTSKNNQDASLLLPHPTQNASAASPHPTPPPQHMGEMDPPPPSSSMASSGVPPHAPTTHLTSSSNNGSGNQYQDEYMGDEYQRYDDDDSAIQALHEQLAAYQQQHGAPYAQQSNSPRGGGGPGGGFSHDGWIDGHDMQASSYNPKNGGGGYGGMSGNCGGGNYKATLTRKVHSSSLNEADVQVFNPLVAPTHTHPPSNKRKVGSLSPYHDSDGPVDVTMTAEHVAALTSENWVTACQAANSTSAAAITNAVINANHQSGSINNKKRQNLSAEDRAKQNRDRNREHARNTRLRKKAYVEELKRTLTEMVNHRELETRNRQVKYMRMRKSKKIRMQVVTAFLNLRGSNVQDKDAYYR